MVDKIVHLANMNLTWGSRNDPLLAHFDDIFVPAIEEAILTKDSVGLNKTDKLLVDDYELSDEDDTQYFILRLVKTTTLEILSKYENGELIPTDISEDSAPFSIVFINLQTHRVGLIKNQKGSPSLANLKKYLDVTIRRFVSRTNSKIKASKSNAEVTELELLPLPVIFVTGLPTEQSFSSQFAEFNKINTVKLTVFPLNADEPPVTMLSGLNEVRKLAGSRTASAVINTPDNKVYVGEMLDKIDTTGTAKINVEAVDKNGIKERVKNTDVNRSMTVPLDKTVSSKSVRTVISKIKTLVNVRKTFFEPSEENRKIYSRFVQKKTRINKE